MSNKKQGCAYCKEKAGTSKDLFNYRPFLRIITHYRDKKIDRDAFCKKWERAQEMAYFGEMFMPLNKSKGNMYPFVTHTRNGWRPND